jgi:hypothetical protein
MDRLQRLAVPHALSTGASDRYSCHTRRRVQCACLLTQQDVNNWRDYYAGVLGPECCYDWERRCRLAQITHSRPVHACPQPACTRDPLSLQSLSAEAHGKERECCLLVLDSVTSTPECCLLHRSSISEGSPKRHPFGFHVQQQKNLDDHVHLQQVPGKQGAQGQAPRERLIEEQTPHMSRRAPRYVNTASVCHF